MILLTPQIRPSVSPFLDFDARDHPHPNLDPKKKKIKLNKTKDNYETVI